MNNTLALIATYNGAKYIAELLGSIDEKIDIIISDDSSIDGTLDVINGIGRKNLTVLDSKPQHSAAKNFARLINESPKSYDYYFLSDQDDVWHDLKFQKSSEFLKQQEAVYGKSTPMLIFTDALVVDENLQIISNSFWSFDSLNPNLINRFNSLVCQNVGQGATMIFNNALINKIKTIPEDLHMHDWWLMLFAASFGRVFYLPEPLLYYRQHTGNVIGARRRGIFNQVLKYVQGESKVNKHISSIVMQAKAFHKQYLQDLVAEKSFFLEQLYQHRNKSKFQRVIFLLRNKIHLTSFKRTLTFYVFY